MKSDERTRFDLAALRNRAGDKVFERGQDYHRDGQVEILAIEPERVLAQVAGTEDYTTRVTGHGQNIGGACSCPAFRDWGFCKHMVATALAANAMMNDAETRGVGALSRIREHLKRKGIDALVEMIVDLAGQDPSLFRKLDLAAATVNADAETLAARLRDAIDSATRFEEFVDYREAAGWAAGVDDALDAVAELLPAGHAALALELAERTIDLLEGASAEIDDSDGHIGALLHRACDIHLAAARAARPQPLRLAADLFTREMEGDYDTFSRAALLYEEVLGETGLAEYRRLASEAWANLPPRPGPTPERQTSAADYARLADILDVFAERDGDVDARIALRAKDLSSPWSYLQLAEFCLSQGREDEALRCAEEGLWIFEGNRPDERLVVFTVALLEKAGRSEDAQRILWRAFEKAPSLDVYLRVRGLAGELARARATEFLQRRMAKQPLDRWHHPADLLVRILVHEGAFDAAWATVSDHDASMSVKEALARASETTHPQQAIDVYTTRVAHLVEGGGDPAYVEAAGLVARMAVLRTTEAQAVHVASLKARFGRKRNFMKLLSEAMRRAEIEDQNRCLLDLQRQFRLAADIVAQAWMAFPEVSAVALIGSVAKPLWKEVPRFRAFRRAGIEVWHECGDLDLALWIESQHRLGELRRAGEKALRQAFEAGAGMSVAGSQLDVFLFEPGSDRYLGRLCSFNQCPKGKLDCLVPGCGEIPFNKRIANFKPGPELLAPASYAMLQQRPVGRLRSALDLPGIDEESVKAPRGAMRA